MSNELEPKPTPSQPMVYQIRLKGHLGSQWTDWFGGLTITLEDDGDTLLTGPVIDQAALHGLLKKVRDLGMPLVSVSPVESYPEHNRRACPSAALGTSPPTTLPSASLGTGGTGQADASDVKS